MKSYFREIELVIDVDGVNDAARTLAAQQNDTAGYVTAPSGRRDATVSPEEVRKAVAHRR